MSRGAANTSARSTTRKPQEPRKRSDLFAFQRDKLIPTLVERKQTAAFVHMGLGKTVSTLTALADLGMPKTLVLAPARVVEMDVWGREVEAWDHLKGVRVHPLYGFPEDRRAKLASKTWDVDVISYNLFPWLCEEVDLEARYGAIVFDELTKMKTPGSKGFKRMRTRTEKIPIRFGLTGSPRPNHLWELWGQMYAVAGEKPLGPSKVAFMMQYFTAVEIAEHVPMWIPNFGAEELILDRIKPWAFHLDPEDAPRWDLRVNKVHVPLPRDIAKLSEDLARELRATLPTGDELLALSASTRVGKVRQMAGGAVYVDTARQIWKEVHPYKLDALEETIDGLQGEPALVAYWYKHERERILKRFPQARELRSKQDEADWNAGKVEVMLVHPASVGHGLNLQFGGHNLIWFTLPHSHEMWEQTNGRLARPGQVSPFTMAQVLIAGEADLAVLAMLEEKRQGQDRVKQAVKI